MQDVRVWTPCQRLAREFEPSDSVSSRMLSAWRAGVSYPSGLQMPEVERVGVEQFSQNFGRLHDSRSGAVEVLVAVGDEHTPGAHGGQLRPLRPPSRVTAGSCGRFDFLGGTVDGVTQEVSGVP